MLGRCLIDVPQSPIRKVKRTPQHIDLDKPIELCRDLERIRMSRKLLTKLSHHYYFDQHVVGCFCRVNISKAKNSWTSQYMVAEITSLYLFHSFYILDVINHSKYYLVDGIKTNKILELKYVDQVKTFDFCYVSNYEFDELEFNTWLKLMDNKGKQPPSLRYIEEKVKSLSDMQTKGYS